MGCSMARHRYYKIDWGKMDIKNCFEYVCPEKWNNLQKTDNKDVRFCGSCNKQVFKATNKKSIDKLANQNKCVAYFDGEESSPSIMGQIVYPIFSNDQKFN